MQEAAIATKQKAYKNLKDLPGLNPTEVLDNMPLCKMENAYFIELDRAASIRSTISNMDTKKVFKTKKHTGGIIIWRQA
jgi:hypothetical protein